MPPIFDVFESEKYRVLYEHYKYRASMTKADHQMVDELRAHYDKRVQWKFPGQGMPRSVPEWALVAVAIWSGFNFKKALTLCMSWNHPSGNGCQANACQNGSRGFVHNCLMCRSDKHGMFWVKADGKDYVCPKYRKWCNEESTYNQEYGEINDAELTGLVRPAIFRSGSVGSRAPSSAGGAAQAPWNRFEVFAMYSEESDSGDDDGDDGEIAAFPADPVDSGHSSGEGDEEESDVPRGTVVAVEAENVEPQAAAKPGASGRHSEESGSGDDEGDDRESERSLADPVDASLPRDEGSVNGSLIENPFKHKGPTWPPTMNISDLSDLHRRGTRREKLILEKLCLIVTFDDPEITSPAGVAIYIAETLKVRVKHVCQRTNRKTDTPVFYVACSNVMEVQHVQVALIAKGIKVKPCKMRPTEYDATVRFKNFLQESVGFEELQRMAAVHGEVLNIQFEKYHSSDESKVLWGWIEFSLPSSAQQLLESHHKPIDYQWQDYQAYPVGGGSDAWISLTSWSGVNGFVEATTAGTAAAAAAPAAAAAGAAAPADPVDAGLSRDEGDEEESDPPRWTVVGVEAEDVKPEATAKACASGRHKPATAVESGDPTSFGPATSRLAPVAEESEESEETRSFMGDPDMPGVQGNDEVDEDIETASRSDTGSTPSTVTRRADRVAGGSVTNGSLIDNPSQLEVPEWPTCMRISDLHRGGTRSQKLILEKLCLRVTSDEPHMDAWGMRRYIRQHLKFDAQDVLQYDKNAPNFYVACSNVTDVKNLREGLTDKGFQVEPYKMWPTNKGATVWFWNNDMVQVWLEDFERMAVVHGKVFNINFVKYFDMEELKVMWGWIEFSQPSSAQQLLQSWHQPVIVKGQELNAYRVGTAMIVMRPFGIVDANSAGPDPAAAPAPAAARAAAPSSPTIAVSAAASATAAATSPAAQTVSAPRGSAADPGPELAQGDLAQRKEAGENEMSVASGESASAKELEGKLDAALPGLGLVCAKAAVLHFPRSPTYVQKILAWIAEEEVAYLSEIVDCWGAFVQAVGLKERPADRLSEALQAALVEV